MKIGAAFNPYKVFQGAFAPYWLLEHRGLSSGAKLCYIRLLGFAGKDARCYPSLETLGKSLGVSERQARGYVKELERSGFIVVEQRGLRKTNVYLFVWTAELEQLVSSVPDDPDDSENQGGGAVQNTAADRNNSSGQDRNRPSALDRNSCSAQDRNTPSGPIGINSTGISSVESTSSSTIESARAETITRTTVSDREPTGANSRVDADVEHLSRIAQLILTWTRDRRLQRLRSDRRIGPPEKSQLDQWAEILHGRGIVGEGQVFGLMDRPRAAADHASEWRNWSFLTLQVQLAAERVLGNAPLFSERSCMWQIQADEDPTCEWAKAKAKIRAQVGEVPFTNWFECTRQIGRSGSAITIVVPDEPTRVQVEEEYRELIHRAVSDMSIAAVVVVVAEA